MEATKSYGFWVMLALLLPLLWLNTAHQLDWGDDNAQYLSQAKDLLHGHGDGPTSLLAMDRWTPSVRGGGFSLLLAPVMLFAPRTAFPYLLVLAVSLVLIGLLYRRYLKTLFPPLTAMLMVLALCYNATVLSMKLDLTPEFPFMALSLTIVLAVRERRAGYVVVGVLVGLLISFKVLGAVMLPALVIGWCWREETLRSRLLASSKVVLVAMVMFFMVQRVVTGTFGLDNFLWYEKPFSSAEPPGLNTSYYHSVAMYFFEQQVPTWFNSTLAFATRAFFCTGVVVGIRKRWPVEVWYSLGYLAVILAYPYRGGGMRFLFPVMPFLLVAVAQGFSSVLGWLRVRSRSAISGYWVVLLLAYSVGLKNMVRDQPAHLVGPESPEAVEALAWLKDKPDAIVICTKPWMVHYCTGLTTMPVTPLDELPPDLLKGHKLLYFKARPNGANPNHFAQMGSRQLDLPGDIIRENADFELLQISR